MGEQTNFERQLSSVVDSIELSSTSSTRFDPLEKLVAEELGIPADNVSATYISGGKQISPRLRTPGLSNIEVAVAVLNDAEQLSNAVRKAEELMAADGYVECLMFITNEQGRWTVPVVLHEAGYAQLTRLRELFPTADFRQQNSPQNVHGMDKDDSEVAVSSGDTWTAAEVESIVAAYLSMLEERLAGRAVNKSHVNRQLRAGALEERSGGAIEYKMQNVSAALADLRLPWIEGYKPAENYQDAIKAEARDTAQSLGLLKTCANQTFREFLAEIENSGLSFEPEFVRAFLVSLATKRFTILTGLSGSGKTQLALQFGRWLGRGRHLVVPVRPDWTGSEALLGYEDALLPTRNGRRAWHVPTAVRFMLRAAGDPWNPYLLLLDEMNLAHVERYFADILSGMESGEPCLPNLVQDDDGHWRLREDGPRLLAFPDNLFVVGTVNVDETTYMFSPKVLDRANTLEFRVRTEDLATGYSRPGECQSGPPELARGFLELSRNHEWAAENPHREQEGIASHLKSTHRLLSESGYEFGHRVFHEALRFSTILQATGEPDALTALDLQILQKVLPRLHGSRRRLEPTLVALARFCRDLEYHPGVVGDGEIVGGDIMDEDANPELPRSFDKLQRMIRALRANQFVSFTE